MLDDHLGENAELYALGTLGDFERARAERHLAVCDACAKRVGQAESTVLTLIQNEKIANRRPLPVRAPAFATPTARPVAWVAAVAAAFLIGLVPWGVSVERDRAGSSVPAGPPQPALAAMLAGHFAHAPLRSLAANAPAAKVLYAREGGWLYVIVAPGPDALDVVAVRGGKRTIVGSIAAGAQTRSAFIPVAGRVDGVELRDRGIPVAIARIAYASH